MNDSWNEPMKPAPKPKRGQAKGNAAPIGSGPMGQTCGSCAHSYRRQGGGKTFYKCRLVKATHGPGSDIRLKWAACSHWSSRQAPTENSEPRTAN